MSSMPVLTKEEEDDEKRIKQLIEERISTDKKELHLDYANINDFGIRVVLEELRNNLTQVKELNLHGNTIGVEGCQQLGEYLQTSTVLEVFSLGRNNIGDCGVRSIVDGLLHKNTRNNIKELCLSGNDNITIDGCQQLQRLLEYNTKLEGLYLYRNNIDDEGVQLIANGLEHSKSLRWLNLQRNVIGSKGCKVLDKVLKANTTLKRIDLQDNNIDIEGVTILANLLQTTNTSITILNLNRYDLTGVNRLDNDQGKRALSKIKFFARINECGRKAVVDASSKSSISRETYLETIMSVWAQYDELHSDYDVNYTVYKLSCFFFCLRLRPEIVTFC